MRTTGAPTNWAGNITFGAERVHHPASVDELRRVVASAREVRVLGSGHSFNRVADTPGDLVCLDALPPSVEIDPDGGTVTVAAGMRYAEVAAALHAAGYGLANLASLPHISVAGCCATGTHGSGDTQQGLAAAVSALELVGPAGDLTWLRADTDPDRFRGAVVGLGALGVVTRMTLEIEPTFDVHQWVYLGLPAEEVAARFDEVFAAAYSVSAFTNWRADGGGHEMAVWLKRRADQHGSAHPGERWLGARLAERPQHPVPGMPAGYATEQLGVPGPWHERLPHFRPDFTPSNGEELQSELLLPRAEGPAGIAALRELADRIAPVLQVAEVRTVAADELWLSPCQGRDTAAFHFTWIKDAEAVLPVIAAIEDRLVPLGARPHWGKLTAMDPRDVGALYKRAADFRRLMLDLDPEGKFRNPFVDEVFPTE